MLPKNREDLRSQDELESRNLTLNLARTNPTFFIFKSISKFKPDIHLIRRYTVKENEFILIAFFLSQSLPCTYNAMKGIQNLKECSKTHVMLALGDAQHFSSLVRLFLF